MKKLRWLLAGFALLAAESGVQNADAQCDPGMPISEVVQGDEVTGLVASTGSSAVYTEYWCLFPTFVKFGSERDANNLTATTFRQTTSPFNRSVFLDACRRNNGAYHVANVSVQRY